MQQSGYDSDDDWDYTPKGGLSEEEFQENVEFFENHPLFMKQLPKDFEKNEDIAALQNLMYSEEPAKIAKHLNQQGGEILKRGNHKYYWREAMKKFFEALEQQFEDDELKSRIYSNMALVNYKLKNYGKVIENSVEAMRLNPTFIKPYFRCAQAYLTLEKYEECVKMSDQGLAVDPNCKEIKDLKKEAEKEIEKVKARAQQRGAEVSQKNKKMIEDFISRGYTLGKKRIHNIPNAYEADPYVDAEGNLNFVTVVTYLEFGQIDVIQKTSETDFVADHLQEIFKERLPWDEKGYYSYDNLAIFIELNCVEPMYKSLKHTNYDRAFYRVSRKKKFSDLLKINGYVMPYVMEIYVLSRASPFFAKFLKEFDITKGV